MKSAEFVFSNSSSVLLRQPAFGIPTINIGDRQRGRLQSESIINCSTDSKSIEEAIQKAMEPEFKKVCKSVVSPYGDGHAAEHIASKICQTLIGGNIDLKKKFYDFEV